MSIVASPITVIIPQLDRVHWIDFVGIFASLMAFGALIVAIVQVRQAKKSNKRIYDLATSQLEQSRIDGQRQYEQALNQIKRENRIRVYAPMLGYLRARLMLFNFEPSSPAVRSIERPKTDLEVNLEDLKKRVSSYEFWAEFELLGDEVIVEMVRKWERDLIDGYDELEDLRDLRREEISKIETERVLQLKEIRDKRDEIRKIRYRLAVDLRSLQGAIMKEFPLDFPRIDHQGWGAPGAQENKNE